MPVFGMGMGKGPVKVYSGDGGAQGEGPGSTKGSKQKAIMPTVIKNKSSFQVFKQELRAQKKLIGKTFMPNILVDVPGAKSKKK